MLELVAQNISFGVMLEYRERSRMKCLPEREDKTCYCSPATICEEVFLDLEMVKVDAVCNPNRRLGGMEAVEERL